MKIEELNYIESCDWLELRIDGEYYEFNNDGGLIIGVEYGRYYEIPIDTLREIIKLYDKRKTLDK